MDGEGGHVKEEQQSASQENADATGEEKDQDDEESCSISAPPAKYSIGEKVWVREAKWGGEYYAAIIRRIVWGPRRQQLKTSNNAADQQDEDIDLCWHYFVHHLKWNTKWDVFAEEQDIFPDTQEIQETARRVHQELRRNKGKKSANIQDAKASEAQRKIQEKKEKEAAVAATAATNKRIKRQLEKEEKLKLMNLGGERGKVHHSNRLPIPQPLISHMVAEWEILTPQVGASLITRRLHVLPATFTVKNALDMYLKSKIELCEDDKEKQRQWIEMCDGVALFFNKMIRGLLYTEELLQLDQLIDNQEELSNKPYSEIYSCFHLLRLTSKLPSLLTDLSKNEITGIMGKMSDLVRFLYKNEKHFFHASYREPKLNELRPEEIALVKAKPTYRRKHNDANT